MLILKVWCEGEHPFKSFENSIYFCCQTLALLWQTQDMEESLVAVFGKYLEIQGCDLHTLRKPKGELRFYRKFTDAPQAIIENLNSNWQNKEGDMKFGNSVVANLDYTENTSISLFD